MTAIGADDRALVEDWGHLRIPAGARALRFHRERGADPAIWIRLELPLAERDQFLADAGYTEPLSTSVRYVTSALLRDQPWWQPDQLDPFESGQVLQEKRRPRYGSNVLLGQTGDHVVAYLFVTGL